MNGLSNFRKATYVLIAVACVCVCAVLAVFYVRPAKNETFTFPGSVRVQGVKIGGLTYRQAQKKLDRKIKTVPYRFDLVVRAGDKSVRLTQNNFNFILDYEKALDSAREGVNPLSGNDFSVPFRVQPESVRKQVARIAGLIDRKPRNAEVKSFRPFSEKRFSFKTGRSGVSLDRISLERQLFSFIDSRGSVGEISAITDRIKPKISQRYLKKNLKRLSSEKSYSYNTENGTINMKLALKACNGSTIKPDEVWSFNDSTGNTNSTANGYRKAEVILRKKLTQGVGGGICQASTTIFKAAALANLGIEERHNHHWASGYTLSGEDATIDYPSLDLKLKNNFKTSVFIESRLQNRSLEVNIYGVKPKEYDRVKLYSRNYDIEYGKSFKTDTFRVLYKNKKQVKKEKICTSYYSLAGYHGVRQADEGSYNN